MLPQFRLKTHGEHEIELNVVYPIPANNGQGVYEWDWYIFTPPQLQIDEPRYTATRFFHDLQQYVRYAPYALTLHTMMDGACDLSPLARIRAALANGRLSKDIDGKAIIYELRVMVNASHEYLGRTRDLIRRQIELTGGVSAAIGVLGKLLDDMSAFLADVRCLHATFCDPRLPDLLREALAWADETMSLKAEKELFRLHALLTPHAGAAPLLGRMREMLQEERRHRMERGYPSIVEPGRPDTAENFVYRESMLKKWAQAVMYMDTRPTQTLSRIVHGIAGFAAAAAMAFAVGATILTQQFYGQFTLPWAILVVIAYILKDRIKELVRSWLIAYIPRLVADEIRYLNDPLGNVRVGTFKSRVSFLAPGALPEEIIRRRGLVHNPFHSILPEENVIHFHKKLDLDCARLMHGHKRLENVEEIVRLHMGSWFSKMDKPGSRIAYIADGKVGSLTSRRVYHVNVVLRMQRLHPEPVSVLETYRVVLCRTGILRVEKLFAPDGHDTGVITVRL